MSVLVDYQLHKWAATGGIVPFDPDNVNSASVDLRLGSEFIDLSTGDRFLADSIVINPGDAYLATTMEFIRVPENAVGRIYLKSSRAREGLDHALAGFIDPGFQGELTMELHAHRRIILHSGQRVVQLELCRTCGRPVRPYSGRYQGQTGPTVSRDEPTVLRDERR